MFKRNKNLNFNYFAKNLRIVIGIVLVWRGIWYVLDEIDKMFFADRPLFTAILGIAIGLGILFIPDGDLKEIEKL